MENGWATYSGTPRLRFDPGGVCSAYWDQPELPFNDGAGKCSDRIRDSLEDQPRVRKIDRVAAYWSRLEIDWPRAPRRPQRWAPSRPRLSSTGLHCAPRMSRRPALNCAQEPVSRGFSEESREWICRTSGIWPSRPPIPRDASSFRRFVCLLPNEPNWELPPRWTVRSTSKAAGGVTATSDRAACNLRSSPRFGWLHL